MQRSSWQRCRFNWCSSIRRIRIWRRILYESLVSVLEKHGIQYAFDFPLKTIASFKIGGPADVLVSPEREEDLSIILNTCQNVGIRYTILGNATNLLIPDQGIRGVVIRIGNQYGDITYCGNGVIKCQAGASLTAVCNFALKHGLTGLEFAFGIPGTAGGAAFMNAGAYGGEMQDVLMSCTHICPDGSLGLFQKSELQLGYRTSVYAKSKEPYIISSLTLQLQEGDPKEIKAKMEDLIGRRRAKQPLEFPSAGSTFKRPTGYFAGALIEECGLKGYSVGDAQVSEKHAGFVINRGQATAKDVLQLISDVQEIVQKQKGVRLETEIKLRD